jgi:outer membrane immunogenic protein
MVRSVGLSALSLMALITAATAADIYTPTAPGSYKDGPYVPFPSWDGLYFGIHGGGAWGDTKSHTYRFDPVFELVDITSFDRSGSFGGGQLGYNWMIAPHFILGIEGDISGASINGTIDACTNTGCSHNSSKTDWLATLRGRVGYTWGSWLVYGTGGAAFVDHSSARTITAAPTAPVLIGQESTATATDTGWTVGGGVEWAFAAGWSAKIEYLFVDYDSTLNFNYSLASAQRRSDTETQLNTIRAGVNYHLHQDYVPLK